MLGVAAVTTVVFQRLRQPVALGYVLAGMIIGPHVSIPIVADPALVSTLSELGVILLMFSIGLEFSIPKIARVGGAAALTAVLEVGLMVALGWSVGHLLGWTSREALFAGACLGISSTMLVAKTFEEQRLTGGFTETVFAILVFEDMIAILLLAVLTAVASGAGLSPWAFAVMAGKLAGFLAAMLVGGLLVVPRAIRLVARLDRAETLLIASLGICFGMALLAERLGYSVALGAFMAGMLVAESGRGARVERLILPFRDVFAAIFFVSVGMTIEPRLVVEHWAPILILTAIVLCGKMTGVSVGAFLAGNGLRRSVRAGMSMAQIGEFSFIIAGLGIGTGATRSFLLPVAVAVSCLTAFATPWLVRGSERGSALVDARLPRRLQTFVAFYGSWIDALRAAPRRETRWTRLRGTIAFLVLDSIALGAVVIGSVVLLDGWPAAVAAVAGASLFFLGIVRCAHRVAKTLAADVVPARDGAEVDLGTAPRRALVLTIELAVVLVVGFPLVVAIQPFVPTGPLVFVAVIGVIGAALWISTNNLHGHVRAGSALILETLVRRADLDEVREMLPGIPGLHPVRLAPESAAVGQTLGELNLRALTGATVLAIHRGDEGTVLPAAGEALRAGDVLALAGPSEAIEAATALLTSTLDA